MLQIGENLDARGVGDPGEKVQFLVWCSGWGLWWYACVSVWAALQLWSFLWRTAAGSLHIPILRQE